MARPQTKEQLLEAITSEAARLAAAVESIPEADRSRAGACEDWSVKDILAHLDEWHRMFLEWHAAGRAGDKPAIPAEHHTWADTPALNDEIFQRHRDDSWENVVDRLAQSRAAVVEAVESYDAAELFQKKKHAWTGSTSVGSYAVSATSSHYAWASKLIRAFAKTL